MSKLLRQIDGTYLTEDNKNVGDLDMAYSRGNPEDVDNVNYAKDKYGYVPKTNVAGSNTGLGTQTELPSTPSLVPAGVPEPTEEADIFNLLTRDALLKFQGVNTADLEKKKRALQMAAIGKGSEVTPEELRTFSPEQQSAIRSGNISPLQSEFDDVSYQLNKAQQATANFESVYEKVMTISQDYAQKMVAPDSVIENYKKLIEADPSNINTYLAKVNDKTRDAILNTLDYNKLKATDEDSNKLLSPTEAAALNVPYGTTKGQAANMGISPKSVLTGVEKIRAEIDLSKQFESLVKDTRSAQRQIGIMEDGYNAAIQAGLDGTSNNAPSQAVLVTFQKLLDPTSVVRESEYARSGDGQSILQRMQGTVEKLERGGAGVTQAELKNFYDLSQKLLSGYEDEQLNFAQRLKTQADNYGLNLENIVTPDVLRLLGEETPTDIKDFNYYKNLYPNAPDEEIQALIDKYSFNSVGGDTELAISIASIPDGEKGGQCGRFVNNISGLGVGDSYKSKLDKMDSNIKWPQPGMVFVMPLTGEMAPYGHTGIIVGIDGEKAIVKDSNWGKDEKIKTHTIPISKMTGFRSLT